MNAYTTIEESKQLIEAGLDINTADMVFEKNDVPKVHPIRYYEPYSREYLIPCWSLAALLNIIDNNNIAYALRNTRNSESKYFISVKVINQEGNHQTFDFEKMIGCITWLLEHNYIKSNKNE